MPDKLISNENNNIVILCGTCNYQYNYLQDQTQCPKCCRRPDISTLIPKQKYTPPKIPTFCSDCHALSNFWSNCNDCNRVNT